jgi:transcriptional antiterminator NusG
MTTPSAPVAAAAKWYVVHVYSGFEHKVEAAIREQALKKGLNDKIHNIVIPAEDATELRKGTRVNVERKFFPGYILIEMELSDETWHMVKNIPKVTGFLGGGAKGKPVPISSTEAKRMTAQLTEGFSSIRKSVHYDVGDVVTVIDGPFNTFSGNVEEVDETRRRLKVSVSIFGRATPVDLDYSQVEKTN